MAETLNKAQRADVERLAWEWRVRGRTVRTIAQKIALPTGQGGLGIEVDHSTIVRALQRLEKRMYTELTGKIEEVKAQQISQLQNIQEIAMEEYDRSRENAELTRTLTKTLGAKQGKGGDRVPDERSGMYLHRDENDEYEETSEEEREALLVTPPGPLTVVEQTTTSESRGQTGDPRYLDVARNAMSDVRKILGLDAQKDGATLEIIVKAYTGVDTDKI